MTYLGDLKRELKRYEIRKNKTTELLNNKCLTELSKELERELTAKTL